jgi:predicted amidohydrolase
MIMRIGVAQMRLSDTIEANTASILSFIENAARQGVRVLGFPETALTGYIFGGFTGIDWDLHARALERIAARLRGGALSVVLGTPTREAGVVRNSAVVLQPDGSSTVYHKINLVPYEKAWFAPGEAAMCFEAASGRFGVQICKDQNSPDLARQLARDGARGVFLCSAHYYEPLEARMKVEKNVALPIARAYENGLYFFKANAVGCSGGQVSHGTSLIIDPRGFVVQRAGETGEELLVHDLDLAAANPHW